jgi:hypothetical protein
MQLSAGQEITVPEFRYRLLAGLRKNRLFNPEGARGSVAVVDITTLHFEPRRQRSGPQPGKSNFAPGNN